MLRLYLIRHGETEWNKEMRFQGRQEIPLNATGIRQAHLLGKRMAGEEIDRIYSSDLGRALETARIIASYLKDVEIVKEPAFREIDFGLWEGLTFHEREKKYPADVKRWKEDPVGVSSPGGESYLLHSARVCEGLARLRERENNKKVILVSHGGPIRTIVQTALGLPLLTFWNLKTDNASVSIVEFYEKSALLCLFNDTCHLHERD